MAWSASDMRISVGRPGAGNGGYSCSDTVRTVIGSDTEPPPAETTQTHRPSNGSPMASGQNAKAISPFKAD